MENVLLVHSCNAQVAVIIIIVSLLHDLRRDAVKRNPATLRMWLRDSYYKQALGPILIGFVNNSCMSLGRTALLTCDDENSCSFTFAPHQPSSF